MRETAGSAPVCFATKASIRCGRQLGRVQHAAGMAEDAKLDGEAEPVAGATEFEQMLAAGLRPAGVFAEQRGQRLPNQTKPHSHRLPHRRRRAR